MAMSEADVWIRMLRLAIEHRVDSILKMTGNACVGQACVA